MSKDKANVNDEENIFGDEEMISHVITEEDLEMNPEFVQLGYEVGEEVEIPKDFEIKVKPVREKKKKEEEGKIPDWARGEGVVATKADEEAFKPKPSPSKVNRDNPRNEEWMNLQQE